MMNTRQRTATSIALTIALLGSLTACGQQEADVDTGLVTSAPTAAAPAESEPTTEAAEETTEVEPTAEATAEETAEPTEDHTTEAQTTDAEPTEQESEDPTTDAPEGTDTPASAAYPQDRVGYAEALLEAWSTGDTERIEALSVDEVATISHCIAGAAGWSRASDGGPGPFDLGWAGYPGLLMAVGEHEGGGRVWLTIEEARLGGPDAIIGADITWLGDLDVAPDCFAHDMVDALEAWGQGDPTDFETMIAPDQRAGMDGLDRSWGYGVPGHELSGLWAFGAYEDLSADIIVITDRGSNVGMESAPLLVLDPQVLRTTTEGSITRATTNIGARRF